MDDFIYQEEDTLIPSDAQNASIIEDDDQYTYRSLTDSQKTLLASLPIPSAILSIVGSSIIIFMAYLSRKSRPWTPYNRLLVGMSVYDIITSIALASAAFLNPTETSTKAWAMGNDSTCSLMGFFNQISYSGTFYNACLSFYFLFTARFGMKNDQITRKIEPVMHVLSVGYPLITGVIGLVLGVYAEPEVGLGCWVNRYPKRCGYGPDGTDEPCLSGMVSWIFGGWVAIGTLIALVINNLIIWIFVRRRIHKGMQISTATALPRALSTSGKSTAAGSSMGEYVIEEDKSTAHLSFASSLRTNYKRSASQNSLSMNQDTRAAQRRRLRLVSTQAFLFVASYIVSNASTYILRLFESMATEYVWEMELPYNNFILLVLQASLLPLQGLFNMLVYIRPKYLKSKVDFPEESKSWAFRRAIWGSKVEPIQSMHAGTLDIKRDSKGNKTARPHQALGKDMISSLTNGSGGAKEEDEEEGVDNDEHETARERPKSSRRKFITSGSNSLEVISEIGEDSLSVSSRKAPVDRSVMKDPTTSKSSVNKSESASILMDGSILQSPRKS
ncbi:unnamed protein product [Cylindrotheca closterium]|uniref:G-protein coupled receptors family 2 profile 2 domain-containing protein n=1 Tax=Cylindrotheca closterium TaxID=2856 RepID=A0AAD2CJ10_9STRA|nr:unnamed protein product [Cylindrotheca closterium]